MEDLHPLAHDQNRLCAQVVAAVVEASRRSSAESQKLEGLREYAFDDLSEGSLLHVPGAPEKERSHVDFDRGSTEILIERYESLLHEIFEKQLAFLKEALMNACSDAFRKSLPWSDHDGTKSSGSGTPASSCLLPLGILPHLDLVGNELRKKNSLPKRSFSLGPSSTASSDVDGTSFMQRLAGKGKITRSQKSPVGSPKRRVTDEVAVVPPMESVLERQTGDKGRDSARSDGVSAGSLVGEPTNTGSQKKAVEAISGIGKTLRVAGRHISLNRRGSISKRAERARELAEQTQQDSSDSDDCDHVDFPLLEFWARHQDGVFAEHQETWAITKSGNNLRKSLNATQSMSHICLNDVVDGGTSMSEWRCMLSPNSPARVFWDVLSAIFIAYDGLTTPLLFFELDSNAFWATSKWFTRIFWTIDLPLNFVTGFSTVEGELEMRRWEVMKKYMKTWLFPDSLVLLFDWIDFFIHLGSSTSGSKAAGLSQTVRIFRLFRLMRLLRLGRLPVIFDRLSEYMPLQMSFYVRAAATVLKILGILLLLAHCIACIWYAVGNDSSEDNWIVHNDLENRATTYLYLTAFHWSLTQFAGTMEVTPRNWRERLFAVITLFFSFMASNIFVSSLTSSMTRFHLATSRQTKMFQELRKFLGRKHISTSLANRVSRNALHAYRESQFTVDEDSVELLRLVSEPLKILLHLEIYSPLLKKHPFFASPAIPQGIIRKMCHKVVFVNVHMPGDVVFACAEDENNEITDMLFVASGMSQYAHHAGGVQNITVGTWLCEPTLWIDWCHFGLLRAVSALQIVALNSSKFQNIVKNQKLNCFFQYAAAFQRQIAKLPLEDLTDVGSEHQTMRVLHAAGVLPASRRNSILGLMTRRGSSDDIGQGI